MQFPEWRLKRRPFLGAPSRLSSDRTGCSVISKLEEKDTYDVGGAKSDGQSRTKNQLAKSRLPFHGKSPFFGCFILPETHSQTGSRIPGPLITAVATKEVWSHEERAIQPLAHHLIIEASLETLTFRTS